MKRSLQLYYAHDVSRWEKIITFFAPSQAWLSRDKWHYRWKYWWAPGRDDRPLRRTSQSIHWYHQYNSSQLRFRIWGMQVRWSYLRNGQPWSPTNIYHESVSQSLLCSHNISVFTRKIIEIYQIVRIAGLIGLILACRYTVEREIKRM